MSRFKNGCIPRVKVPRVRILHLVTRFEGLEFSEKKSLEQMQVEKVRRVRIRRGYRMHSSIVEVGKVRRVRIL